MKNSLISVGFGSKVAINRILGIKSYDSAPIKRIVQEARDNNRLIDATYGRETKAVIITDSDHFILSMNTPETLNKRLQEKETKHIN